MKSFVVHVVSMGKTRSVHGFWCGNLLTEADSREQRWSFFKKCVIH